MLVGWTEHVPAQSLTTEEFADLVDRLASNLCLGSTAREEFVAFVTAIRGSTEVPSAKTRRKVSNAVLRGCQLFRDCCFAGGHKPSIVPPLLLKPEGDLCTLYLTMRSSR
eukprot:ANDGO_05239.mRNA.1 hypothetical protein